MDSDTSNLITTAEAGKLLNLRRRAILRLVRQGYLPGFIITGLRQYRVPRQAVLDLLAPVRGGTPG